MTTEDRDDVFFRLMESFLVSVVIVAGLTYKLGFLTGIAVYLMYYNVSRKLVQR